MEETLKKDDGTKVEEQEKSKPPGIDLSKMKALFAPKKTEEEQKPDDDIKEEEDGPKPAIDLSKLKNLVVPKKNKDAKRITVNYVGEDEAQYKPLLDEDENA